MQAEDVTAEKDNVFSMLSEEIGEHWQFTRILFSSRNKEIFSSKNNEFPPTEENLIGLRSAIKEDNELLGEIAVGYCVAKSKSEEDWIDNLLQHILPPEIAATLPTIAKNSVLRELEDNISDLKKFKDVLCLKGNKSSFSSRNKEFPPTLNTDGLKNQYVADLIYQMR
jgi:hypothetical protein